MQQISFRYPGRASSTGYVRTGLVLGTALLVSACEVGTLGPAASSENATDGDSLSTSVGSRVPVVGEPILAATGTVLRVSAGDLANARGRALGSINWTSSNPLIVQVERLADGATLRMGASEGTAVVTAQAGGQMFHSAVRSIRSDRITQASIVGVLDTIRPGTSQSPALRVSTVSGESYETRLVEWSTQGDAARFLADSRTLSAERVGVTTITGRALGRTATRTVTVSVSLAVGVISTSATEVAVGGTAMLEVSFPNPYGGTYDCQQVQWTTPPQSEAVTVQQQSNRYRALLLGVAVGTTLVSASCDSLAAATVQIRVVSGDGGTPTAATGTELRIFRVDSSRMDSVIVSSGIPFQKGRLRESDVDGLRLLVDGLEVQRAAAALDGRHPDGSVRSVLLQFATTPDKVARPVFLANSGRTLPPKPVATPPGLPAAIVAPADPTDFARTGVVGPTRARSETPTTPAYFFTNEANWVQMEAYQWSQGGDATGGNYYDRVLAYMAFWVRTGNPLYFVRGARLAIRFRDEYLKPASYQPPEWYNNLDGLMVHYLLTGDPETRDVILHVATKTEHAYGTDGAMMNTTNHPWMDNRVQARVLNSKVLAIMLGAAGTLPSGFTPPIVDLRAAAAADLTAILSTQRSDGSYRFAVSCQESSNFMTGLLNGVLAQYYEEVAPDPRIPTAVAKSFDFLIGTQWLPQDRLFQYYSGPCPGAGGATPGTDLNGLFLSALGWLYTRTGDPSLRALGDEVFRGGVEHTFLSGGKQFNQWFQMSWRWLGAR